MLSIKWIKAVDYYLKKRRRRSADSDDPDTPDDADAADPSDYYFDGAEGPGEWWGTGAMMLGLINEVKPEDLQALCQGFGPDGTPLIQNAGETSHQMAWDFTFSVPKSLSVLWSQVNSQTRQKISEAVRKATITALAYLVSVALFTRRGKGGKSIEQAFPIVAIFRDSVSRELEPQLHDHCVLLNVAGRLDGTFGTILSKPLYRHKLTAGAIFQAELAHQCRHLGLKLEQDEHAFRVVGVPQKLCDQYSTRSKQIRAVLQSNGHHSAKAAALATLHTRRPKSDVPPSQDDLLNNWREINASCGFTEAAAQKLFSTAPGPTKPPSLWNYIAQAIDDLLETESYFSEQQLIRQVAKAVVAEGVASLEIINQVRAYLLEGPGIVALGSSIHEPLYTTEEMLKLEEKLLQMIELGKNRSSHVISKSIVERMLDAYLPLGPHLTDDEQTRNQEQRAAIIRLTTEPGNFKVLEGMAGTGKTYVFSVARQIWEKMGYRVLGVALSAVAAANLQEGSGIESETVAMRLVKLDGRANFVHHHKRQLKRLLKGKRTYAYQGRDFKLDHKTILVWDEAAMGGTRQFARLVEAAAKAGAKIVASGDRRQLQPIDAGNPFPAIADMTDKAELQHVTRQRVEPDDPNPTWHRQAGKLIAAGHVQRAIKLFKERGRFTVHHDREQAKLAMVRDWSVQGMANPADHFLLAGTRAEVSELNAMCQAARASAGYLGNDHIVIDQSPFHQGDIVLIRKNCRLHQVKNGDRGVVLGFNRLSGTMAVRLNRTRKTVFIPYRSFTDFQLGYAMTTHIAQGATVPSVYVLLGGPVQDRHLSYVQTTRACESTRLYVDRFHAGPNLKHIFGQMAQERPKELIRDVVNRTSSPATPPASAPATRPVASAESNPSPPSKTGNTNSNASPSAVTPSTAKPSNPVDKGPSQQEHAGQKQTPATNKGPDSELLKLLQQPPRFGSQAPVSQPIAKKAEGTRRAPSQNTSPASQRVGDLAHVHVSGTTDEQVLRDAIKRYGKLPGGIVVEGQARSGVAIHSLAVDATQPNRLIVNGQLVFDTGLSEEEVALLWQAVLQDKCQAITDFGVLSQTMAIGIDNETRVGVNMMTADNWLGGVVYGKDAQFRLCKIPISSYRNACVAEMQQATNPEFTALLCMNELYSIRPQFFLAVKDVAFAKSGTSLAVTSTNVSAAIGVLESDDRVVTSLADESSKRPLIEARFPWIYRSFQDFVARFRDYAALDPHFCRTIKYAELVMLLRHARSVGASLAGHEHVRRQVQHSASVAVPRFNYTLRSAEFATLLTNTARSLAQDQSSDEFARLMAAVLGHHYATKAGDAWSCLRCQQIATEYAQEVRLIDSPSDPSRRHRELVRLLPVIEATLDSQCHDLLIGNCLHAASQATNRDEHFAYVEDARRHCRSLPDTSRHAATRCREIELEKYAFSTIDDLAKKLARVRKDHPTSRQPFLTLQRIKADIRSSFGSDGPVTVGFVMELRKEQLGYLRLSKKLKDVWDRLEGRVTTQTAYSLLEELFRCSIELSPYAVTLQQHPNDEPMLVLTRHLAHRMQGRTEVEFSPTFLSRVNPFVDCDDLLLREPRDGIANLFAAIRSKVEVFPSSAASGKGLVGRVVARFVPEEDPKTWWQELLRVYAFINGNSKGDASVTALQLAHEMSIRGLTVPQLHEIMRRHNTKNPQAALFFFDLG